MKVKIRIEEVYDSIDLENLIKYIRKLREQFYSETTLDFELEVNVKGVQV
jgi:hypothetical protein